MSSHRPSRPPGLSGSGDGDRPDRQAASGEATPRDPEAGDATRPSPPVVDAAPRKKSRRSKKPRRWRRRLAVVALVLVLLVALLRLAVPYALPWLVEQTAATLGLTATYDRIELSLLDGNVELWHLRLEPLREGESTPPATDDGEAAAGEGAQESSDSGEEDASRQFLLELDYERVDVSLLSLLTGSLRVERLEIDGVNLIIERDASGALSVFGTDDDATGAKEEEEPIVTANPGRLELGEIPLASPIRVDALRLQHVRATFRDLSVEPAVELDLRLDVRLSDLGSPHRRAHFELVASIPGVLDRLRVDGEGTSRDDELEADLGLAIDGLDPRPLAGYLGPLGLRADTTRLSFAARASASARRESASPAVLASSFQLRDVSLESVGEPRASIEEVRVDLRAGLLESLGGSGVEVSRVTGRNVRGRIERLASGALRVSGLTFVPVDATASDTTDEPPAEAPPGEASAADTSASPTGASPHESSPSTANAATGVRTASAAAPAGDRLRWKIEEVSLESCDVTFRDDAVEPAADLAMHLAELSVRNLRSRRGNDDSTVPFLLRWKAPGIFTSLRLEGTARPFASPPDFEARIAASGITMEAAGPYLSAAGLETTLDSGELEARVSGSLILESSRIGGSLEIAGVELTDTLPGAGREALLSLETIRVSNLRLESSPAALRVDDIVIGGSRLEIERQPNGALALLGLRQRAPEVATTSAPRAATGTSPAAMPPDSSASTTPPTRSPANATGSSSSQDRAAAPAKTSMPSSTSSSVSSSPSASPPPAGSDRTETVASAPPETTAGKTPGGKPGATPSATENDSSGEPVIEIGRILLEKNELTYRDLSVEPAVTRRVSDYGVEVRDLLLDRQAETAARPSPLRLWLHTDRLPEGLTVDGTVNVAVRELAFDLELEVPQAVSNATFRGAVTAGATSTQGQLTVDASGIGGSALAGLCPPGVEPQLEDGRLRLDLDFVSRPHDAGGHSLRLELGGLDYREAGEEISLLEAERLIVDASRIDGEAGLLALEEISLKGLQSRGTRLEGGGLRSLGFAFTPPPPSATAAQPGSANGDAPDRQDRALSSSDAALRIRRGREKLPLVTLEKLDLELARYVLDHEGRAQASPLEVTAARLVNTAPVEILGDNSSSHPPTELELTGEVSPVISSVRTRLRFQAFAPDPHFHVEIELDGIRGEGLEKLHPNLSATIDGDGLRDGQLRGELDTVLTARRQHPLDFDFPEGFGLHATFKDVTFRVAPDAPVVAGVEEVDVLVERIDPATGDVHVRSVHVAKPIGDIHQEPDGLHVLGLVIRQPARPSGPAASGEKTAAGAPISPVAAASPQERGTGPSANPATAPTATAQSPGKPPAGNGQPAGNGAGNGANGAALQRSGEVKIDDFLVTDIDLTYRDSTVSPPLEIPVRELDLETYGFSTRALSLRRPLRFSTLIGSGLVPIGESNGGGEPPPRRQLFQEFAAEGNLTLTPDTHGWVKSSVNSLELAAFRGPASESSVTIDSGLLDAATEMRFQPDGSLHVDAVLTFTNLSLSEPIGGPISTFLKLPAPLDTVIFLLRNERGAIRLPLSFDVRAGRVTWGEILRVGSLAMSRLIAEAVAKSPFRVAGALRNVAGTVGGFVGLLDMAGEPQPRKPLRIEFPPAGVFVGPQGRGELESLAKLLEEEPELVVTLRHELGGGDVARATVLANPSRADTLALAEQLESKRRDLLARRRSLAARARGALSAGLEPESAVLRRRVQTLDEDLAGLERAFDRVHELLDAGSDRHEPRRTRVAAIHVARERLEAIRRILAGSEGALDERIRISRPTFREARGNEGGHVVITVSKKNVNL